MTIDEALALPFSITAKGYALISAPNCVLAWSNGQMRRCRYVAWLAGKLTSDNVGLSVHHLNGDKLDDRPENLARVKPGEHISHHWRESSPQRGKRISAALMGHRVSVETRRRIANSGLGNRNALGKRTGKALENIRAAVRKREEGKSK